MDENRPPHTACPCGAHRFARVTVERAGREHYITDFVSCKECGAMFHWPARHGILPTSPERVEFIERHGMLGTAGPRSARPAMQPKDRGRVDIADPHDVRYWTSALLCSRAQLARAVQSVGPEIVPVRRWLADGGG